MNVQDFLRRSGGFMSKLFLLINVLFSQILFASELDLIKITNDEDKEVTIMYVDLDQYNGILSFGKRTYNNGVQISQEVIATDLTDSGVVLERQKSRDVIILRGLNYTPEHGGTMVIDYLYNGITGARREFNLDLDKMYDSWKLMAEGKVINHIHLKSHRKRFIGLVGIAYIEIRE